MSARGCSTPTNGRSSFSTPLGYYVINETLLMNFVEICALRPQAFRQYVTNLPKRDESHFDKFAQYSNLMNVVIEGIFRSRDSISPLETLDQEMEGSS